MRIIPPEQGKGCSGAGYYLFGMADGSQVCYEIEESS